MPKIISNTKGITLDKDGQPQVDNSFEGPAYVVLWDWVSKKK